MKPLRASLRTRLWWRVLDVRGWLRWHLPVSRDTALRLAEEQAEAYSLPVERQVAALFEVMAQELARFRGAPALRAPEPRSPDRRLRVVEDMTPPAELQGRRPDLPPLPGRPHLEVVR